METKREFNIVVVDADPTYLKIWERILKDVPNCRFLLTNDPKGAEQLIKGKKLDMLISEVLMSANNGYDLANIAHARHPDAEIILTTSYSCNLSSFDLKDPKFSILYKPYNSIADIQKFIVRLLNHENPFEDASEDSFSENDDFPAVMEWKL